MLAELTDKSNEAVAQTGFAVRGDASARTTEFVCLLHLYNDFFFRLRIDWDKESDSPSVACFRIQNDMHPSLIIRSGGDIPSLSPVFALQP